MAESGSRVLRAADRFRTERSSVSTTHGFSFGDHYDPERISFGALVAHNVETLPASGGYEPHLHRDVEIVSWVTRGALQHSDDHGHLSQVEAGSVQRLTAAAGVTHAEINPEGSGGPATQFVQLWLRCPADDLPSGAEPSYEQGVVPPGALRAGWVALASSESTTSPVVRLHVPGTTLWAIELGPGAASQLPSSSLRHVYVVWGAIAVDDAEILDAEDTMMLRDCGPVTIHASQGAQVLALCMPDQVDLDVNR